jgi:uncharacterized membrane protein (DUF373 family)
MATRDEGSAAISRATDAIGEGLVSFELVLYASVGLLLGLAGVLILGGTVSGLVRGIGHRHAAVDVAVLVLDRVLLALIVGELLYTLRFVVRTHEIAVEPFLYIGLIAVVRRILYIGLIAVVRRILIVTAQFERSPQTGRALTNTLLEFGLLGLMVPSLAAAVWLVRRSKSVDAALA